MFDRYANSLTATNGCSNFAENDTLASTYRSAYQPAIATRLNKYLDGLVLTATDIGPMMDLCVGLLSLTCASRDADPSRPGTRRAINRKFWVTLLSATSKYPTLQIASPSDLEGIVLQLHGLRVARLRVLAIPPVLLGLWSR